MGLCEEEARAWIQAQAPEGTDGPAADPAAGPLQVWPENWPVLGLFLRLQTQWVKGPDGRREGLRYEAAESAINLLRLPDTARLFDELVEMEHAALEALNG